MNCIFRYNWLTSWTLFYSAGCFWNKGSNGLVEVPYTVSSSFSSSDKQSIENALRAFPSKTCIRFVPRQNQVDFISYEPRDGCWSSLGRVGGQQKVSLQMDGCVYFGVIQHETLHALGFQHEQTRSDRDQYVTINWRNIDSNNAYNFDRSNTNNLNTPYDYSSVMHYGKTAFSINGMDTITPIPNPNVSIGQRQGLSTTDILRINRLYSCWEEDVKSQEKSLEKTRWRKSSLTYIMLSYWFKIIV